MSDLLLCKGVVQAMNLSEALLGAAKKGKYAIGAFNMHNVETTQALLIGAERANSPLYLQVGRAVIPHMGVKKAYEMTQRVVEESDTVNVIHLDHGSYDEVLQAIKLGFTSVMYDGAHLTLEKNIETTRRLVEIAHEFGVVVEAELGKIPDANQPVQWSDYYTNVDEAERFVAETGVDSLAISAGVVHGVPAITPQPLAMELIAEIKKVVPVPLVLHGASGIPEQELKDAISAGICKFNADTDLRLEFRRGIEETWAQGDRQLETAMALGREYMANATFDKLKQFGCADRADDFRTLSSIFQRQW